MHSQAARLLSFATAFLSLSLFVAGQAPIVSLEVGKPIERDLAGGDTHVYRIQSELRQYLQIVTEQKGVDVIVDLIGPDGSKVVEVDSPNGTSGPEIIRYVTRIAGAYELRIMPGEKTAPRGIYVVRVEEQRPALPRDEAVVDYWKFLNEGKSYDAQNDFPNALIKYQAALKSSQDAERETDVDRSLTPIAQFYVGRTYRWLARYGDAIDSYSKALPAFEAANDYPWIIRVLGGMGSAYYYSFDYDAAIKYFQKAVSLAKATGERGFGNELNGVGNAFAAMGDNARALENYNSALKQLELAGDLGNTASVLNNIGRIYHQQGNTEQALVYLKRALEIFERLKARGGVHTTANNVGACYGELGDFAEAEAYLQKGLKAAEELHSAPRIQGSMTNFGHLYRTQGDYQKAMEFFVKARDSREIAALYILQKNYAKALEFANESLGHQNTNESPNLWVNYNLIGRAHLGLDHTELAKGAFEKAIAIIETQEALSAGTYEDQQRSFEGKIEPFHNAIILAVMQGKLWEAFLRAERAKARTLLGVLQNGRTLIDRTMSADETSRERTLRKSLTALTAESAQKKQAKVVDEDLEERLAAKRLEFEDFRTRLYAAHPELKVHRGELNSIDPNQAGAVVKDRNTAVAEFVVTKEKSFLFVLTKNESKPALEVHPIDISEKELALSVEKFRSKLANRDLDFSKTGLKLYDLLLKPAIKSLAPKTNIIIVPDGPLWDLPFQSLQPAVGTYLVETTAISYAPSVAALRVMSSRSRTKTRIALDLLAFGNPSVATATADAVKRVFMDEKLLPLPDAERLVRSLGRLYGPTRSKVFMGRDAREETAKSEASKYRVIHFATHGILNDASPMYSNIVLSQEGDNPVEDGLLEAWEMEDLNLKADMVVLSACETARGRVSAGEGMIGMTWALFIAGTPTTVASQWKVESSSTTELMLEFHRQLLKGSGISKAEALRQASLKLLRSSKYRHPSFWGGWVMIGNGS